MPPAGHFPPSPRARASAGVAGAALRVRRDAVPGAALLGGNALLGQALGLAPPEVGLGRLTCRLVCVCNSCLNP